MQTRDLEEELLALKAQVEALSEGRSVPGVQEELVRRLSDVLKGLSSDVKESKPSALLASFLAGVAIGRLTAK